MKFSYLLILLVMVSFSFVSCEKEEEFIICPNETSQVCEGGDPYSGNHIDTTTHGDPIEKGYCGTEGRPIDTAQIVYCGPTILPIDTTKIVYCGPGMLPNDTCEGLVDKVLTYTIKNSEVFEYNTQIGGDEESAQISCQSSVYDLSELNRGPNMNFVYRYKPAPNLIGQFSVKIKSFGVDLGTMQTVEQETILIKINVTE